MPLLVEQRSHIPQQEDAVQIQLLPQKSPACEINDLDPEMDVSSALPSEFPSTWKLLNEQDYIKYCKGYRTILKDRNGTQKFISGFKKESFTLYI